MLQPCTDQVPNPKEREVLLPDKNTPLGSHPHTGEWKQRAHLPAVLGVHMGSTKRDGRGPAASQSQDFEADRVLVSRQAGAGPAPSCTYRGRKRERSGCRRTEPSISACHCSPPAVPCGKPQGSKSAASLARNAVISQHLGVPITHCQLPARVAELLLTLTAENKQSSAELEETN